MKDRVFNKVLMIILGIIFVSLCWYGCQQSWKRDEAKKEARRYKEAHPFEKYVYLDTSGVLHRNRDCINLIDNAVTYFDTLRGFGYQPDGFCTFCFSTEQYEAFLRLEERARKRR